MINLSFSERINIIIDAITSNEITKYFIPGILLLTIFLILFSRSKKKVIKIILSIILFGLLGSIAYYFSNPIMSFFDYLVEVIVNDLLFPNLALYIFTILVIDITLIISILSNKMSNVVKGINIFFFTLMQILLFFIVTNVINNNIDVYEALSIYTNQELLVLVEASMIIFALWIIISMLVKLTKSLTKERKVEKSEEVKEQINYNNSVVLDYNEIMREQEFIEYVPIKKKRV